MAETQKRPPLGRALDRHGRVIGTVRIEKKKRVDGGEDVVVHVYPVVAEVRRPG